MHYGLLVNHEKGDPTGSRRQIPDSSVGSPSDNPFITSIAYGVRRWLRAAYSVDASYTLLSLLCIESWCRTFLDGIRSVSAQ